MLGFVGIERSTFSVYIAGIVCMEVHSTAPTIAAPNGCRYGHRSLSQHFAYSLEHHLAFKMLQLRDGTFYKIHKVWSVICIP